MLVVKKDVIKISKQLFNEKQIKGLTTELIITQKFIELGFIVSIPYGNNSRYDLLVDTGNHIWKIQCKTAKLNENGSYNVIVSNGVHTATTHKVKHYTKEEIDFIVTIIENQLVVIPVELVENSRSKVFRTTLPKYGSKSSCNLIQDYTVEKYII